MSKKYGTIVFILRGQPIHNAHTETIRRAGKLAHQVILVIGSSDRPRTYKNPFSYEERKAMLMNVLPSLVDRDTMVRIEKLRDSVYDDTAWAIRVQEIVQKHTIERPDIAIIGHSKDESSFYLKMFPQWEHIDVPLIEELNATDVRSLYFRRHANLNFLTGVVPEQIATFLHGFRNTDAYLQIIREREFVDEYKKQYASLRYAPTFITGDALVFQSGHVLLVKRRAEPGKGLLAIPGGYLNAGSDKSVVDCAIRELFEETKIKVPEKIIRGSIVETRVFDAINRSERGRIVTHAVKIVLPDGPLPKVKGSDDAETASFYPINSITPDIMFEDHWDILQSLL
jgi:bifunctional NMN adenylyltransferase/nudix hydrolase